MQVIVRCCWVHPLAFHFPFQMAALDLALEPLAGSRSRRILYIVDGANVLTRNVKSIPDVHRVGNIETTEAAARASFVNSSDLFYREGLKELLAAC